MPKSIGEQWLSAKDAAEYLGITLRTLYRLIDSGALPAYKLGRVIRLKRSEVDEFVHSCRIQPGDLAHLYPPSKPDDEDDVA